MTTREVADRLKTNTRQVARLVHRGDLTASAQAPGRNGAFLFDEADIESFAENAQLEERAS